MVGWGLDFLTGHTVFDCVFASCSKLGDPELPSHSGHELVVTNVKVGSVRVVQQKFGEGGFVW